MGRAQDATGPLLQRGRDLAGRLRREAMRVTEESQGGDVMKAKAACQSSLDSTTVRMLVDALEDKLVLAGEPQRSSPAESALAEL
jgi:hypothetical protein